MAADIEKALSLQSQGKLDEAEKIYKEFLEEEPKQPDVSNLLGLVYLQKQNFEKAEEFFEIAVEGFPCATFCQNLGLALYRQGKYNASMECLEKVLGFEPKDLELARNIAQMAKKANQVDYAIKFFNHVLELEANDCVGWNQLGLMHEAKHDYETAKNCYIKSLKCKENFEAAHNLGVLHRTMRNFDESIKCLHQALKLRPNYNETMISLGMSYLSKKDLKNGQKYYQYLNPEIRNKYRNHWDGKKHPDSTLFVFYYAGYGDHIMFSRYLPYLKNYFKTVKVWLPPSVRGIIEKNIDGIEFVDSHTEDYDYSANMMELHFLLNIDFDNIPTPNGYLKADERLVSDYKKRFFEIDKKKIGLFWQGNPNVFANRSIKLKELSLLFNAQNVEFYSFEKGDPYNQIEDFPHLTDVGATFKNYSDTAAALMNLDLLVTIDSSIAHLAGALGVKTFLMLPYSSEWRWFEETQKTDWYNSITIFKQEKPWSWGNVVNKVFERISEQNF